MSVASGSSVKDLELQKFLDDANGNVSVRILSSNEGIAVKSSNTGLSTIKSDLTTSEFEITAVTGQKTITVANLDAVLVHVSLSTGVTNSNKSLGRGDEFEVVNYAGSVFVIRASGTGSIQIDQESLV